MLDTRNYRANERLEGPAHVQEGPSFASGELLQEGQALNLFNTSSGSSVESMGFTPASQLLGSDPTLAASISDDKTIISDENYRRMMKRLEDAKSDQTRRSMDKGQQ